jgi:surface antigen
MAHLQPDAATIPCRPRRSRVLRAVPGLPTLTHQQSDPDSSGGTGLSAIARRLLVTSAAICAIAGGPALVPPWAPAASAATAIPATCLSAGQDMQPGDYLAAPPVNGGSSPYELIMQTDGNLVAYTAAGQALWDSQTFRHPGAYAALQSTDGNLVVYSPSGQALWSASVPRSPGDRLCMQDDGNVVVYSAADSPLWATMTTTARAAVKGESLSTNPGAAGQCTWWAEQEFHGWTGMYINTLGINGTDGNAEYWAYNAAHRGWAVGTTPRAGSIAVFQPGVAGADSFGHVAWVTQVYPSQNAIEVSEMNFEGPGIVDSRRISPAFGVAGLQYIYANP